MAFDSSDPAYQDLLARVLQSEAQVVPFVGAGLSVYGKPDERLPLWRELLERLIVEGRNLGLIAEGDRKIEGILDSGRYIEATEHLVDSLGEPTFKRIVRRELDDSGKPVPPAIAELVTIGWSLIVTTNLDRMITRAYLDQHERPMSTVTSMDLDGLMSAVGGTLRSPETVLGQIHGNLDTYASWRLTKSHYRQLLQTPGYVEAIRHLFLRQVFFVGFGLQDEDFEFVLETIAEIYPSGGGEIYALIPSTRKGDAATQDLIRISGLRPIYYAVDPQPDPSDPFGGHKAVYECLAHLATAWATTRTGIDLDLKYFPEIDPNIVGRDQEVNRLTDLLISEWGRVVQLVGLGGLGKTSLVQQFLTERRPQIAAAGYRQVFGCSFYRADIGQFINDLALTTVGPMAAPLPEQVEAICDYVRRNRLMLVLDGVEAILDTESRLRNPYVLKIVDCVIQGGGSAVATTRVGIHGEVFEHAPVIDVEPLSPEQILEFLDRWGLDGLGEAGKRRLIDVSAGHPLALRILAGVLKGVSPEEAIATVEQSAVIDIADEVDPLRENRLARVLGSYIHHLEDAEISFMICSTAFQKPAPYPLVEAALTRHYPDTAVNAPLRDRDLRPIVGGLLERRLLTVSADGLLSSHPTVREYFVRRAHESEESLAPIHRFLGGECLRSSPKLPETFEEAVPLLTACRHAAACRDWSLFDELLRRRLMRTFRHYLCNNLGAWEETLDLARLGDDPTFPISENPEPGYYPFSVARSLKHLGRSSESRAKYLDSLKTAAELRDPDTAMYVNNFLTLLVWRGELANAEKMIELNIRALSWIVEPWRRRWQIEHGFSSIAYLRTLRGDLDSAEELFDYAARAWEGYSDERLWIYDYYPYYRSEGILLADPGAHEEALSGIEALLAVAHSHGWPESICRGHNQAAVIHLDRASRFGDRSELTRAVERLDKARLNVAGMTVADVAIANQLAWIKAELVRGELDSGPPADVVEIEILVDRAETLISTSGLALAGPDLLAAKAAIAHLQGSRDEALRLHRCAIQKCKEQGNALAPGSPRSLVAWVGERLGALSSIEPSTSTVDPIGLVGEELNADWMSVQLAELA
jgi:tetratricopeptide (TPR) repeat protein